MVCRVGTRGSELRFIFFNPLRTCDLWRIYLRNRVRARISDDLQDTSFTQLWVTVLCSCSLGQPARGAVEEEQEEGWIGLWLKGVDRKSLTSRPGRPQDGGGACSVPAVIAALETLTGALCSPSPQRKSTGTSALVGFNSEWLMFASLTPTFHVVPPPWNSWFVGHPGLNSKFCCCPLRLLEVGSRGWFVENLESVRKKILFVFLKYCF